uniref:Uncharacterized protein n=1 Tax=Chenopodium quinoa TaxID=63459 RepID=A0A803MB07_CHEQI
MLLHKGAQDVILCIGGSSDSVDLGAVARSGTGTCVEVALVQLAQCKSFATVFKVSSQYVLSHSFLFFFSLFQLS